MIYRHGIIGFNIYILAINRAQYHTQSIFLTNGRAFIHIHVVELTPLQSKQLLKIV